MTDSNHTFDPFFIHLLLYLFKRFVIFCLLRNLPSTFQCYVSASEDGAVKIWDGVSSRCITTFFNAHDGAEVCSAAFTKNGKYIMTSGKDSMIKLWELSTSRCLIAYTGAGATGKQASSFQVYQPSFQILQILALTGTHVLLYTTVPTIIIP